jgi:hypothetical protein
MLVPLMALYGTFTPISNQTSGRRVRAMRGRKTCLAATFVLDKYFPVRDWVVYCVGLNVMAKGKILLGFLSPAVRSAGCHFTELSWPFGPLTLFPCVLICLAWNCFDRQCETFGETKSGNSVRWRLHAVSYGWFKLSALFAGQEQWQENLCLQCFGRNVSSYGMNL